MKITKKDISDFTKWATENKLEFQVGSIITLYRMHKKGYKAAECIVDLIWKDMYDSPNPFTEDDISNNVDWIIDFIDDYSLSEYVNMVKLGIKQMKIYKDSRAINNYNDLADIFVEIERLAEYYEPKHEPLLQGAKKVFINMGKDMQTVFFALRACKKAKDYAELVDLQDSSYGNIIRGIVEKIGA